jgi:hypothetical protein
LHAITAFVDSIYRPLAEVGALLEVMRDGEQTLFKGARSALGTCARDKVLDLLKAVDQFYQAERETCQQSPAAHTGEVIKG